MSSFILQQHQRRMRVTMDQSLGLAIQSGGTRATMVPMVDSLADTIVLIATNHSALYMEVIALEYLSAFAYDETPMWPLRRAQARTFVQQLAGMTDLHRGHLLAGLDYLTELSQAHPQAAKHFGNVIVRLHPRTVPKVVR